MSQDTVSSKKLLQSIRDFLKDRFNLSEGKASEKQTIEGIRQGVAFRGSNLWILIFAILVASVGLDSNSTAVIIGAMLISPLMGPIMGIGLGVGIFDGVLVKRSFLNFGISVLISILVSAIYFWFSPTDEPQSELLARTAPDFRDVLISVFGGFAGIIAGSRKEKSNAIPGVAIATALMPPLCTIGFGIAHRDWTYIYGPTVLFFINSVFIGVSTIVTVRLLGFRFKEFVDPVRKKNVRNRIIFLCFFTALLVVPTTIDLIREKQFKHKAEEFLNANFDKSQYFNQEYLFGDRIFTLENKNDSNTISFSLVGKPLDDDKYTSLLSELERAGLPECKLNINSTDQSGDLSGNALDLIDRQFRANIIAELYKQNEQVIRNKDDRIKLLEGEILDYKKGELPIDDLLTEIKTIEHNVEGLSVAPTYLRSSDSTATDTVYLAYIKFLHRPNRKKIEMLENWLKTRIKAKELKMITD